MGAMVAAVAVLAVMGIDEGARMESFNRSYESRRIEEGALIFENNCRRCHGPQGEGTPLGPALNTPELFDGTRLQAAGFAGTLEDFIAGTVASGRPVPSEGTNFPERMPTWSEEFGGPFRIDQVENVVSFILNWEQRALAGAEPTQVSEDLMMGHDFRVELPEGEPEVGKTLAEGALGCAACHILSEVGPAWAATDGLPGLAVRAEIRIQQEDYQGESSNAEEYLIESVIQSNAFVVDGYVESVMPTDFGERLTLQDMADLLAYMLTFR
jgi:mono/diheme cytochrome c family protein